MVLILLINVNLVCKVSREHRVYHPCANRIELRRQDRIVRARPAKLRVHEATDGLTVLQYFLHSDLLVIVELNTLQLLVNLPSVFVDIKVAARKNQAALVSEDLHNVFDDLLLDVFRLIAACFRVFLGSRARIRSPRPIPLLR